MQNRFLEIFFSACSTNNSKGSVEIFGNILSAEFFNASQDNCPAKITNFQSGISDCFMDIMYCARPNFAAVI